MKRCAGLLDCGPVAGEHRAGEAVGRRRVHQLERLLPPVVGIDEGGDDRSKQLLAQQAIAGVAGLDHRRLDEVALRVVIVAAGDYVTAVRLGFLDRL